MKKEVKIYFWILNFTFLLSIGPETYAQNKTLADSLISYLNLHPEIRDSLKFSVCKRISEESTSPSQALYYAKEAYKIALNKNNYSNLGSTSILIGEAYRAQGKLVTALEKFFESEQFYINAQNIKGQGVAYSNIASLYSVQENYKEAHRYFDKAIKIFREEHDTTRLAILWQNKGNAFRKMEEPDSAIIYFKESLRLFSFKKFELGIAYNLGNIGLIYAVRGDFTQAEEKVSQSLKILEKYDDFYAIADFSNQMGDIYFKNSQIEKAFSFVNRSLTLATEHGLKEQIRDASLKLSELYAQTAEYEKAYQFHTQYVAYRDSINNEEVIRKMADLRTEYEVSQKQAEIDLLTKQRQINQLVGLALLFILLLLMVLAFLLYRNNRIKQSANKTLNQQKSALEMQHQKLEALNNTKDRFFSIISHDLRGPVNAFNGISELIKHYIAKNEMGQLREISEYLDKSARQLSTLLDNLLDWAIKQQGAFPFKKEKIYLNPILGEQVDMFRITAHAKNITMTLDVEEEMDLWADRNSLLTIIRNLLNNALKFTEKDGLVSINAYTEKDFAHINVIDTGVGITEEKLERIFELQDKSGSEGTSGEKGLGIGLNLAYEFALMNGGTIMVNSEVNAGTIFTLKVPVFKASKPLSVPALAEPG